ncbi:13245_t:CDS:1, partial [Racocetra persica]
VRTLIEKFISPSRAFGLTNVDQSEKVSDQSKYHISHLPKA